MAKYKSYAKKNKKKEKKSFWRIPLTILAIFLLIAGMVFAVFRIYYKMSRYIDDNAARQEAEKLSKEENIDETGLTEQEAESLRDTKKEVVLPKNNAVYNILLIGVDRRDETWSGNSDTMILMSVNKETKTMHMISLMRDLYADIPGHGVRKLNAACAYGGAPLLVETIEKNYGVPIDNYASVDFNQLVDIIDLLGGVELTLSDAEVQSANGLIKAMCEARHVDYAGHLFTGSGTFNCDGYQAVAYARIRHVGNADYERTERQRTVMTKLIEKARHMNVTKLNTVAKGVLPHVTHNLKSTRVLLLLAQMPSILKYELIKDRVPYDGMYTTQGELLVPDMDATIEKLQTTLYPELEGGMN